MDPFDPNSPNALFAKILERLDQQDASQEKFRLEIREALGRVTALERESWKNRGIVAGIALAVSAIWHLFTSNKTS